MKTALITGITDQDGSYLDEVFLEKGYSVYGRRRHSSTQNIENIQHLQVDPHIYKNALNFLDGDLLDSSNLKMMMTSDLEKV